MRKVRWKAKRVNQIFGDLFSDGRNFARVKRDTHTHIYHYRAIEYHVGRRGCPSSIFTSPHFTSDKPMYDVYL